MESLLSTALAGIKAATARFGVSARNIANWNSTGPAGTGSPATYQAKEAVQTTGPGGAPQVQIRTKSPATVQVSALDGSGRLVTAPNVDLAEEFVNDRLARQDFMANLKVLETAQEMEDQLLDLKA